MSSSETSRVSVPPLCSALIVLFSLQQNRVLDQKFLASSQRRFVDCRSNDVRVRICYLMSNQTSMKAGGVRVATLSSHPLLYLKCMRLQAFYLFSFRSLSSESPTPQEFYSDCIASKFSIFPNQKCRVWYHLERHCRKRISRRRQKALCADGKLRSCCLIVLAPARPLFVASMQSHVLEIRIFAIDSCIRAMSSWHIPISL